MSRNMAVSLTLEQVRNRTKTVTRRTGTSWLKLEPEAERDAARADRDQADDAATQAVARMEELERELGQLRTDTEQQLRGIRDSSAAEIRQAREDADRDISTARGDAARQVADAEARADQAEHDAGRARETEAAAVARAERAQATAVEETARIRSDHRHALNQLTAATDARITALEETRDALRVRAERAEADLDAARGDHQRLTEQLAQLQAAATEDDQEAGDVPTTRPRTTNRTKKTPGTRGPRPE